MYRVSCVRSVPTLYFLLNSSGTPSFRTWIPIPFANEEPDFSFSSAPRLTVVPVASVPEKEVWILAYPDSLNPPLHCSSILKSFPPAVVPTPLRSLRLMVPTGWYMRAIPR